MPIARMKEVDKVASRATPNTRPRPPIPGNPTNVGVGQTGLPPIGGFGGLPASRLKPLKPPPLGEPSPTSGPREGSSVSAHPQPPQQTPGSRYLRMARYQPGVQQTPVASGLPPVQPPKKVGVGGSGMGLGSNGFGVRKERTSFGTHARSMFG